MYVPLTCASLLSDVSKAYGVACFDYLSQTQLQVPLRESNPRVPRPWSDTLFYYAQADLIKEANKGKAWKWCEVRPDQIVGTSNGTRDNIRH
jgi:hypothetical protein